MECKTDHSPKKGLEVPFFRLGHSDLNSHFKNLNTSNTSFTLGEPHKPKHALSTLTSKHVSEKTYV